MKNPGQFFGKKAIICGGSKGIGKETAKEFLRLGGSVSIVARGKTGLREAYEEMLQISLEENQFIETIACDTTDYDSLKPHFDHFVDAHGVPDYLLNCVGYAYPNYLEKFTLEDFRNNMEVNYFGQVVPMLIILPYMIEAKKGHIAFVSSVGGFIGLIGYATYSPTKFAVAGLAEVLRHELKPYNIDISVLYPPDTDTPGLAIENQTKPKETEIISGQVKLASPEKVANKFVDGLRKKKFRIIWGDAVLFEIIKRLSPRLLFLYGDIILKSARKKLGKT